MKIPFRNFTTVYVVSGVLALVAGLFLVRFLGFALLFFFLAYGCSRQYVEFTADKVILCMSRFVLIEIPKRKITGIRIEKRNIKLVVRTTGDKTKKYTVAFANFSAENKEILRSCFQQLQNEQAGVSNR